MTLPEQPGRDKALSFEEQKGRHGNFFAIDRRTWARVCDLGMNPAVAYLVQARGTGGDNRTTSWSTNAIEKYTGISRGRAKESVQALVTNGMSKRTRDGSMPRYDLLPFHELPSGNTRPTREPMTDKQRPVYELVKRGDQPTGKDRQFANTLTHNGWLTRESNGVFHANDDAEPKADWIWLPNELVTGAGDETPPVELVRQTRDVMTLRLLVDFYHGQNLREDGGISRRHTYRKFERHKVGQQGQYIVWGFEEDTTFVAWSDLTNCHKRARRDLTKEEKEAGKNPGVDFFRRLESLDTLGLIEWVPYLFEGDDADAEPIHPYGIGMGDTLEGRVYQAADAAGAGLVTEGQREWARENGLHLVPVPRHMANVQLIGIARLRYRPKTKTTAAWWGETQSRGEEYIRRYTECTAGKALKAAS